MFRAIVVGIVAILVSGSAMAEEPLSRFDVNFDTDPKGPVSASIAALLFGPVEWETLKDRARIVEVAGGNRVLEVQYPKGEIGSQRSGASFVTRLKPTRKASLEYKFRFGPEFPFTKGGKLPGLGAGGSRYTGGRPPGKEGGWSARLMWRREGELELYFYHPGMKSKFGESHLLGVKCEPEKEYCVRFEIDAGTEGKENGRVEVFIDGESRIKLENLLLVGTEYGLVDSFLFSTFFGGNSEDWGPARDGVAVFDEFVYQSGGED